MPEVFKSVALLLLFFLGDTRCSSRGQIITKLKLNLRTIVQEDNMILGDILQIFTYSTGFKALEFAFVLDHESDKDKVVCRIEPR